MKAFKKNQLVVAVIGLMLITAGYLNFTNNQNSDDLIETGALADSEKMASIGDAKLVSTTPTEENMVNQSEKEKETSTETKNKEEKQEENTNNINKEEIKNTIKTNAQENSSSEYFTQSRLDRDTMYSQTIGNYQKMLDNKNIGEAQKNTAQKEIKTLNEQKNAIMIAENLIKTKGIEDLVIFINGNSVNVIVKAKKLGKEQIAQIQNIITRELKANIENIHISNKE